MGNTKTTEQITVVSRVKGGFRRAGYKFTEKPTTINTEDLSEEQLEQIKSEPNLVVMDSAEGLNSVANNIAETELKEVKEKLEAEQKAVSEAEQKATALEAELKEVKEKLEAEQKAVSEAEKKATALEAELKEVKEKLEKAEKELKAANKK